MTTARRPLLNATAAVVAIAILVGGATPARADDLDAARTAFEEGRAAFRAGRYAEAAEAYERSSAAHPHPAPLVNAAEAWELEGNRTRAAQACDRALALEIDKPLRTAIEQRLARLARSVATLSVRGASDIGVRVDGGEILTPPSKLRLSPGGHRLTYVEAGKERQPDEEIRIAAGEERVLVLASVAMQPSSAPASSFVFAPTPRETRARSGPPLGSWISFGIGGAAAATSAVFGVLTLSAKDAYESDPTRDTLSTFEDRRLAANIAFGSAVLAIGVGVVWWLLDGDHAKTSSTAAQAR